MISYILQLSCSKEFCWESTADCEKSASLTAGTWNPIPSSSRIVKTQVPDTLVHSVVEHTCMCV